MRSETAIIWKYSQIVFSDFLWTMRSIYLPLFLTMQTEIPRADLYHCVATGYAGGSWCHGKTLLRQPSPDF
ncbi:MAG: DUF3492 domain-containing protein [Blautia sp.]